jgi:conjugative relaxase-like TrwC/TraI family protein
MLTISKPISASQAKTYHREEFQNSRDNYYTENDKICGEWHGKLAAKWGLQGAVNEEHFARLSEGQHPHSGEQLVRHQTSRKYANVFGDTVKAMEHRAGWDATFSAPKSVSLTALVGSDERVREAHRQSVTVALDDMERYVQARMGGNTPALTTSEWAAAKFEHDSSRPVDGYAAPQLHTHVVFFNITELENGETRALQPQELYRTQQYATAVYRSELALRLKNLGYEIEQGKSGQPEICGYTQEYLEASSPRSKQIKEHLAEQGMRGAESAQLAALQTRDAKLNLTHEQVRAQHQQMAQAFGNQPERVVREAQKRHAEEHNPERKQERIDYAINYSLARNLERQAVVDERDLVRDALKRSMGEASFSEVHAHFEKRVNAGELITANVPIGRAFTTGEMIRYERENISWMRAGQGRDAALVSFATRREVELKHSHLNSCQRSAVEQVLSSRDQITALEGVAGSGKTTSLTAIREASEREGYKVEGLAPTSRAAQKLAESGVESHTLQYHLAQPEAEHNAGKHLYIVDETSLVSTKQVHEFLSHLQDSDRVLLVGDVRQHQAVDAGAPYQQLQEAGMQTARLDEIVRQKDPALKEAVEQLARGEVRQAVGNLNRQGRVHQIENRDERLKTIASEYVRQPEKALVVSPDNESRQQINALIHRELQARGQLSPVEQKLRVLISRQELTGADRTWATQYERGDVVRYSKGSARLGIGSGEYARVENVDRKQNLVTVERHDGERQTYDPRRLQGVAVYRESERALSQGERVQFTAPNKELKIANREQGLVEKVEANGNLRIKTDAGRTVEFNVQRHPHIDYGYAVTSHSSQGQTSERVLIHADTAQSQQLLNRRMAYVSVSRAQYDAQIYTNNKAELADHLNRDYSHSTALGSVQEARSGAAQEKPNMELNPQSMAASPSYAVGTAIGEAIGQ